MVGATVQIADSSKGVVTNANGYYALSVPADSVFVLVFSYLGKKPLRKRYAGELFLEVFLEEDLLRLEGVEVTANPTVNEIDVRQKTGVAEVVEVSKLKDTPVSSLALALQGKVNGLQIINRGELGRLPEVRIRGRSSLRRGDEANQPLYILDGRMISAETFFYLNPEDIGKMKVLKDAVASALYGIKAANGVIEISTKRGGKRMLSCRFQTGLTLVSPLRVKMMNTKEKLRLEELLENESMPGYKYSEKYILKKYGGTQIEGEKRKEARQMLDSLGAINTNWHKELTRIHRFQKYDLSYRNGTEKLSYYLSLGFFHQGGQLEGNDFLRISSRFSLDQAIGKKAFATLSVNSTLAKTNTPNGSLFSPEALIYQLNPYESKKSKALYSYPDRSFDELFKQFSRLSTNKNLGASVSLNWELTPHLVLSAVSGLDFSLAESLEITPSTAVSERKKGKPANALGMLRQDKNTNGNFTSNLRINYNRTYGKHDLTLGANADNYTTFIDNINITGHGLYGKMRSAASIDNSLDGAGRSLVGARKHTERNLGFGAVVGYTYASTYNLFATYKIDASSVLPRSKRWNTAWALGASIDLKSYFQLKKTSFISALKLRLSYGQTANAQGILPALTLATFRYTSESYSNIRFLEIMNLPNKKLKAEQNKILDIGLAISIEKINFQFSVYKRITQDALLNIPIASSSGFLYQLQNVGVLQNQGIEMNLNRHFFSSSDWSLQIGANISYNENKVLDLYGKQRIYTGSESILPDYELGKATDVLYGLRSTGINPITGLPEFINHEGKQVDAYTTMKREDYVALGKSTPPISGGFFCRIGYKNLQISSNFYYTINGIRNYENKYIRNAGSVNFNAAAVQLTKMWFAPGDDNKTYHSPFHISYVNNNLSTPNTGTIARTDFLRFSNLSIKYKIDTKNIFKRITLGISVSNLFTLSGYKDSNPESGNIINPLPTALTFHFNTIL